MTGVVTITEPSRLLTRKEAAGRFSVSETTFDTYVDQGIAPEPIKIGRSVRWHSKQIGEAIDKLAGISPDAGHGFW